MLIRYRRSEDGKAIARALVYTAEEHRIDRGKIDPDAIRIVERLRESGHEAYIVGGAVRDLLLGRVPKDFDIVTDAEPARIKRVFRNARVIGRRFRLVHVYAGPKIFEVSTFRSIASGTVGNEFGTIDEDALRRDFTCNALYYDPVQAQLVDYVGGFKHIHAGRIVPVIPLKSIFKEDAVRMIRCVKYASTSGFRIPLQTRWAIKRDAGLLADASPSRLTEEFLKILASGKSAEIIAKLESFGLLGHLVPGTLALLSSGAAARKLFFDELDELDAVGSSQVREKRMALLIAHFIKAFLESRPGALVDTPEAYQEALRETRLFLSPLNLPRVELEAAVLVVFKKRGISPRERPRRPGPERGHGLPERAAGTRHGPRPEGKPEEGQERSRRQAAAKAPPKAPAPEVAPARGGELPGSEAPKPKRKRKRSGARAAPPAGAETKAAADEPSGLSEAKSKTSGAARRRRRKQRGPGSSPDQGATPAD